MRPTLFAAAATAALAASSAAGFKLTVQNNCAHTVELYAREGGKYTDDKQSLASGASTTREIPKDFEGHFRHGQDDAATLVEFATKGDLPLAWYDISIIPPRLNKGFEFCGSLNECKKNSQSGKGFNVAVQVTPLSNTNGANCAQLTCLEDNCKDAYLFPKDDIKTHSCPIATDFKLTFCPGGAAQAAETKTPASTPAATTKAPTAAPTPAASKDEGAGKVSPGNYDVDEVTKQPGLESGTLTKAPATTAAPTAAAKKVVVPPATTAPPAAPIKQVEIPVTQAPPTKASATPSVTPAATQGKTPKPKRCLP